MTVTELNERIAALVAEYLKCDQAWGDNPMLEINPETFAMRIAEEEENEALDYVDMMDLLHMSVENPGQWEADPEAIAELASSYDV